MNSASSNVKKVVAGCSAGASKVLMKVFIVLKIAVSRRI